MKAIETQYAGCRFRSRLEARWAVFFDALGIKWRYELEGFDLGSFGWYLPDFYLPEQKCWVEIKGEKPTEKDIEKTRELLIMCRDAVEDVNNAEQVYIFYGDIPWPYPEEGNAVEGFFATGNYSWKECPLCRELYIAPLSQMGCRNGCLQKIDNALDGAVRSLGGVPDEARVKVVPKLRWTLIQTAFLSGHKSDRLRQAYKAARSARFEGGRRHLHSV